jgi:hypothetical protein
VLRRTRGRDFGSHDQLEPEISPRVSTGTNRRGTQSGDGPELDIDGLSPHQAMPKRNQDTMEQGILA